MACAHFQNNQQKRFWPIRTTEVLLDVSIQARELHGAFVPTGVT
jgi:hypothetical protein